MRIPTPLPLALVLLTGLAHAQDTATGLEQIRAVLPPADWFVERDGQMLWVGPGDRAHPVVGIVRGGAAVEVGETRLDVAREVLERDPAPVFAVLDRLLEQAAMANLDVAGLQLRAMPLLGVHLGGRELVVLPEGALAREDTPERAAGAAAVEAAATAVLDRLDDSELSTVAQRSLRAILGRLHRDDRGGREDEAVVAPSFARLLVRHGWLQRLLPDDPAATELTRVVTAATELAADASFRGPGGTLQLVRDAFGSSGFVLSTPERAGYTVVLPEPQFVPLPIPLIAIVHLPPGADPLADPRQATAVEVLVGADVAVAWRAGDDGGGSFVVDEDLWRRVVPASGRREGSPIAHGLLPPHVLLAGIDGDVYSLITRHGRVDAPRDASAEEAARFVREAAAALPDPVHLDLIGEFMFRYVFDSPDPRHPELIGSRELSGEIHQTAEQTLATVAGGISRGDCDDIAELYQRVLAEQGKLGHLLRLPAHCALGFCEKAGDRWNAYVLQTGPPLEFRADTLPEALGAAYREFNGDQIVDPHQLGISLRFSGENTRSDWVLSYRIFAEPDYAATMIDIQRDWHYHTYRRGFVKMEAMVAGGDQDTANYRELSGLCQSTGQFAESAKFLRLALERVDEVEAVLNLKIELVGDLLQAGDHAAAGAIVEELLAEDLAAAASRLGGGVAWLGLQLASLIDVGDGDWRLGARVLAQTVVPTVAEQMRLARAYLGSRRFDPDAWANAPQWFQVRQLSSAFVATAVGILQDAGAEELRTNEALVDIATQVGIWLRGIGFHETDEPARALIAYALAAEFYEVLLGRDKLLELVDEAEFPAENVDHRRRESGPAQIDADIPWIKLAFQYWTGGVQEQFERGRTEIDRDLIEVFARRAAEAREQAERLGLFDSRAEAEIERCRLIAALVREDEDGVRAGLRFVRDLGDKGARDDAARWIGFTARFLPLEWYRRVIELWREEIDFKPSWFEIAWAAAHHDAPEHALLVAKVAAERHADDPAFVEEYAFMRALFAKDK